MVLAGGLNGLITCSLTLTYKVKPLLFGATSLGMALGGLYCFGLRSIITSQFKAVASEDSEYVDKEGFKL